MVSHFSCTFKKICYDKIIYTIFLSLFKLAINHEMALFLAGWLWGDPHIVTLDSGNYTFNGLGEFTMVDVKDGMFQLQARTKLAKGEGTATVFSAAVAKEQQTSTVQANLKDEGHFIA